MLLFFFTNKLKMADCEMICDIKNIKKIKHLLLSTKHNQLTGCHESICCLVLDIVPRLKGHMWNQQPQVADLWSVVVLQKKRVKTKPSNRLQMLSLPLFVPSSHTSCQKLLSMFSFLDAVVSLSLWDLCALVKLPSVSL